MSNINSIQNNAASNQLRGRASGKPGKPGKLLFKIVSAPFVFVQAHLFTASVVAILLYGWARRDDNYITAENGAGYILGIVGGVLMLILMLYPLSKRTTILTRLIPMRYWFGIHMLFGVIGPVMILFHSNFHIGSANSTIALTCMLLVAGSGVIGRYFYTNIHHGLYGNRITFEELKREAETKYSELLRIYEMDEKLHKRRTVMEGKALQNYPGILQSIAHVFSLAVDSRRLHFRLRKILKSEYANNANAMSKRDGALIINFVKRYTKALRRIAAFRVYERFFSAWHVLHLPLFFMMLITAVIHIFAVHMY